MLFSFFAEQLHFKNLNKLGFQTQLCRSYIVYFLNNVYVGFFIGEKFGMRKFSHFWRFQNSRPRQLGLAAPLQT